MQVEVERPANDTAAVALEHVRPGAEIDVRPPTVAGSFVRYTAFNLSIADEGSYDLTLRTSASAPDGTVAPTAGVNGMRPHSYMVVSHPNLPNESVSNASFTFSVDEANLSDAGAAPEHVALFRKDGETWTELETELVDESTEAYTYRADATELSVFAVATKRQSIAVDSVSVDESTVDPGTTAEVRAVITNDGRLDGTYTADLTVFGERVDSKTVSVPAGESVTVTFTQRFDASGTYDIIVGGERAEVSVTGETTSDEESPSTPTPGQSGFTAGLVALAFLVAVLLARRQ